MAKIKRREVQLKPEHQKMVKSLIVSYNLKTDSQALIRALIIASKAHPALIAEKSKLEEDISKLQDKYNIIHRNSVNYLCSAKIMYEHLKSDVKI